MGASTAKLKSILGFSVRTGLVVGAVIAFSFGLAFFLHSKLPGKPVGNTAIVGSSYMGGLQLATVVETEYEQATTQKGNLWWEVINRRAEEGWFYQGSHGDWLVFQKGK